MGEAFIDVMFDCPEGGAELWRGLGLSGCEQRGQDPVVDLTAGDLGQCPAPRNLRLRDLDLRCLRMPELANIGIASQSPGRRAGLPRAQVLR